LPQAGLFLKIQVIHLHPKNDKLFFGFFMYGLLMLILLLLVALLGLILRYRQMIARKNRNIVRQIKEQDRLEKSMEQALYKNITLYNHIKEMNNKLQTLKSIFL
jgi:uncharacterized membrane protein YcgQ (UPF0703/DUF1980 family)